MAIAAPLRGFATPPVIALFAAVMLLPAILSFGAEIDARVAENAATIYYVVEESCVNPGPTLIARDPNADTTFVEQLAEQNTSAVAQNIEPNLWPDFGAYCDEYDGMSAFWSDDIVSNLFPNIGQLLARWCSQNVYQILLTSITSALTCIAIRRFKRN